VHNLQGKKGEREEGERKGEKTSFLSKVSMISGVRKKGNDREEKIEHDKRHGPQAKEKSRGKREGTV